MRVSLLSGTANDFARSSPTLIDLDARDVIQRVRALKSCPEQPQPQVLIDCGTLKCQRTLGVSHVISQLLLLRHSGAQVWLRNVNPVLRRCLHMLHLEQLFPVAG